MPDRLLRRVTALAAVFAAAALAGCGVGARAEPGPAPPAPSASAAPAAVVMIIRHGEKPDGTEPGVDADGHEDDGSLTAAGWRRAHALVGLFDPAGGAPRAGLARPTVIYAAGATDQGEGQRTRETVAPLADALGVPVRTGFGRGDERELAEEVEAAADGGRPVATLIAWQHGGIPAIAEAFPHVRPDPPREWPEDRFDVVWVLTRTADGWRFSQVPEQVLPGDRDDPVDG